MAKKKALSKAEVERRLKLCNPFERFVIQHLGHHLKLAVPKYHRKMYEAAYNCAVGRDFDRLLIEAPRSFGKSYIFSFFLPLYLICTSKNEEMIAFSRDIDLAMKFLRYIKQEIETSKDLRYFYGIEKGEIWSKKEISYSRADGHRGVFRSMSKGMSPRGWHPQFAIIDDPQKTEDARSDTVRDNDWEWFVKDFSGMMQKQPVIFIGTRVHPLCMVAKVAERPGWEHLKFAALDGANESIWPQHMSTQDLEKERLQIGNDAFMSEYMNEPIISANPIFRKDEFRYYQQDSVAFQNILREGMFTVTYIDPAISKRDTADYTAITTVSATLSKKPDIYVRECKRGHWSLHEAVDEAFKTSEQFRQRETIIESNAYQLALLQQIVEEERLRGRKIGSREVRNDKDKERRAHKVTPMLQEGRIYFDNEDAGQQRLIDELLLFPTGDYDDCADAFIGTLERIQQCSLGRTESSAPILVRAENQKEWQTRDRQPIIVRQYQNVGMRADGRR